MANDIAGTTVNRCYTLDPIASDPVGLRVRARRRCRDGAIFFAA